MITKINYMYILLVLILVFPITIIRRQFYFITLVAAIFIIAVNLKYKFNNNLNSQIKLLLNFLIIIFSVYALFLTIIIDTSLIFFTINKVITLLFFITLLKLLSHKFSNKLLKYIEHFIFFVALFSIIFYFFNIDGFRLKPIFDITMKQENLLRYNERRLSWFYEHKIQFATTCLIGLQLLLLNTCCRYKYKILKVGIFILAIYLSNSKLSLVLALFMVLFNSSKYIIKYLKNKRLNASIKVVLVCLLLISIGLLPIFLVSIYSHINASRNLSTLGSRTIIWRLVVDEVRNNPLGIIKAYGYYMSDGIRSFTTAHNFFLNEFLETGVIGGVICLFINIIPLFLIRYSRYKLIIFEIIFIAQFDYLISGMFAYVYYTLLAILIIDSHYHRKCILRQNKTLCSEM
ncbi:O-antigen ligase family protein [Turicibacter sp. H121]|uniref:O-antigen ligase family protein n=1 Tax=Turicibacter sp. H121 TaxID=1712675 RepID=UPI00076305AA|nr:O-antigen ligase family protein [Turicibacter sp. H121]AMC08084.1 hypothetical protein AT726_03380 [Turicibacter sp. H121]MCU7199848.1 O-antigen ligase family protein [Turicibacter sp. H121]